MSRLLLFVGVGGFAGAVLRYGASGYVQQLARSSDFSYGTVVVNVLGCFLIGFFSQLVESRGLLSAESRALLVPGFLGSFTTSPHSAMRHSISSATVRARWLS
jgi:CrcB protein